MNCEKYIGLDVHQATRSVAVRDSKGKVVMESILETKASTILEFFAGLRGTLSVTLEEGTWAAWLHDLLKAHVARVVVCNPRKNALLKHGNKSDRIDARKLADLFSKATRWDWLLTVVYIGCFIVIGMNKIGHTLLADKDSPYPFAPEEMEPFDRPGHLARIRNAGIPVTSGRDA